MSTAGTDLLTFCCCTYFFSYVKQSTRQHGTLALFAICRHSSAGRSSSKSVQTVTWIFCSSAEVFPIGLAGRNNRAKHSSRAALVSWPALAMLKPQASGAGCKFSLHWGICNAWLSYCNASINLLFLSVGDRIHFPLLLCVILVFQLTFDSKNLGSLSCPTLELTIWSAWEQK